MFVFCFVIFNGIWTIFYEKLKINLDLFLLIIDKILNERQKNEPGITE